MQLMIIKLMLALFGGLIYAGASQAETLEQAWQSAVANNHQLKSTQADTEATEQQLSAARGQRWPELNVSTGYSQYNEAPAAKATFGGQTAQFNTAQSGSVKALAIASLPLFTSGRISHNILAAEAAVKAAEHHESSTELTLKMQVADAYIAVLRSSGAIAVANDHVASLAAHHKDVANLFDQGMVAKNDVLAAKVQQANAEQIALQARNRLDNANASYNQLLDRNLTDAVQLSVQLPLAPEGNMAQLSAEALGQRPELAVLAQQIAALEEQAKSVSASALPQISVNAGFQYQDNRYQVYEGLWLVNVGLQWKLFDGSTRHNSNALHRLAMALQEQRDDLTSTIGLQVRQAYLDRTVAQQRITVSHLAIAEADENLAVVTDRYRQGLATNTEVLVAEDLRTQSHDNYNNASYDAVLAVLQLRRAVGVL